MLFYDRPNAPPVFTTDEARIRFSETVGRGQGLARQFTEWKPTTVMVKSTIIVRASDALPLAATVDDEQVKRVRWDRALYTCLPTLCID